MSCAEFIEMTKRFLEGFTPLDLHFTHIAWLKTFLDDYNQQSQQKR
jgi:hypothetical protein